MIAMVVAVTLLALAVFFGVGVLGLRLVGLRASDVPPVVAVVIGHVVTVSLFAVGLAHGRTSLLALLAASVTAGLLWRRFGVRPAPEQTRRLDLTALGEQAAVAVAVAVLMAWPLIVDGQLLYPGLQQDSLHYTRLAAFVNDVGAECPRADRLVGADCRRLPYHFFDAWTAALLSRVGLHMTLAFAAASTAVLASSLYGVCRGLAARLGAGRLAGAVALCVLLVTPEAWILRLTPGGFMYHSDYFALHLLFSSKLLPASLLLMLAVWAWATPASLLTPLLLASTAIVQTTTAPSVGVALAVLLGHDLWRRERGRALAALVGMGLLGLMGVWFAVETRLRPGVAFVGAANLAGYLGSRLYLRTAVNVMGKTTLQMAVQLAPYALLAALTWSRASTRAWLRSAHSRLGLAALGLALVVSLGGWAVIHYFPNSAQLFTNLSSALFPTVTVLTLGLAVERGSTRRGLGQLALGLSLVAGVAGTASNFVFRRGDIYVPPSASFRASAVSLLTGAPGLGVRFMDASTMSSVDKNLVLGSPEYLLAANPSGYEVAIPVGEIPLATAPLLHAVELSLLRGGTFFQFAERETGKLSNDPETIRRFVATMPFDHVACEGPAAQVYCQPRACEDASPMAYCRAGRVGRCVQDGSYSLCRPGP